MAVRTREEVVGSPVGADSRSPDRGIGWGRLLRLAGGAECVALLIVAAVLGDLEAAAVAVGFALGLGLLHHRSGLLGRILLGLLSANVLAWMSLGAVSNISNGQGLRALVIPALLSSLSFTGLIAALMAHLTRGRASGTSGPKMVAVTAVVLFAAVVLAGVVAPARGATTAPGDLLLTAENVKFTETELQAPQGEIGVVLQNRDLFWHTFTIDELGVDLPVAVAAQRRATFSAQPGTYTYYCRIPGHEALMRGTLTVMADG